MIAKISENSHFQVCHFAMPPLGRVKFCHSEIALFLLKNAVMKTSCGLFMPN